MWTVIGVVVGVIVVGFIILMFVGHASEKQDERIEAWFTGAVLEERVRLGPPAAN